MGVDLKRPMWAFAMVSVLCAVLMMASIGRGDTLLDLFHAPRPISAPQMPQSSTTVDDIVPEQTRTVVLPPELTAQLVVRATHATPGRGRTAAPGLAYLRGGLTPRREPARR